MSEDLGEFVRITGVSSTGTVVGGIEGGSKYILENGNSRVCSKWRNKYRYSKNWYIRFSNTPKSSEKMENAINLLEEQVGKPYVWGATGPEAFDCSGLVRYVYKTALGKEIPRVSYDQSKFGQEVDKKDLQVGDLIFFDTMKKGRVSHVGMYIGNNEFIHASSPKNGVKKSKLSGYYEEAYRGARRP